MVASVSAPSNRTFLVLCIIFLVYNSSAHALLRKTKSRAQASLTHGAGSGSGSESESETLFDEMPGTEGYDIETGYAIV